MASAEQDARYYDQIDGHAEEFHERLEHDYERRRRDGVQVIGYAVGL